jgi:hypothetical protein
MPRVRGFGGGPDQSAAFAFADGVASASRVVEQNAQTGAGWIAVYVLGGLDLSHGFNDPGQAAGVVLECMAGSPDFYTNPTGATLVASQATTVGGDAAWMMKAEIRADNPDLDVTGDAATVIVVDTGDPESYGLYVSLVPIGDRALMTQEKKQESRLRVG